MEEITILCDRFDFDFEATFYKDDIYQMVEELYEEDGYILSEETDHEELIEMYKENIFDMYDYRIEEQYKEYLKENCEVNELW